jgi:hypothetical protein
MKDIVKWLREAHWADKRAYAAADEIERLRQLVDTLEEEVVNLCQQRLKLRETLYEIAKGPRDADKSYVSLLHEVQSEALAALEGRTK